MLAKPVCRSETLLLTAEGPVVSCMFLLTSTV